MTDHLDSLRQRLANETARLNAATKPREIEMRTVWVKQYEKEIAAELALLEGRYHVEPEMTDETMTDDELLAALEV